MEISAIDAGIDIGMTIDFYGILFCEEATAIFMECWDDNWYLINKKDF